MVLTHHSQTQFTVQFIAYSVAVFIGQALKRTVPITYNLSQSSYINKTIAEADKGLSVICRCQNLLPRNCKEHYTKNNIRPILDYGGSIYVSCPMQEAEALETI